LTSVKDGDDLSTALLYDAQGRNIRWTYPDGSYEAMTYSLTGDLATHRAQDGLITTLDYAGDRTLKSRAAAGRVESFQWNALGQMLTAAVLVGGNPQSNLTFNYDGFNRQVSEVQPQGTVTYGYDLDDNLTAITYPGGYSVTRPHDNLNRLTQVSDTGGVLARYDWIGPGRVDRRRTGPDPAPLVQDAEWDGYGRLEGLDAGVTLTLGYGLDELGWRTYKDHELPNLDADVYLHDGGSRLASVYYDDPAPQAPGSGDLFVQDLSDAGSRKSTTFLAQTTQYNGGGVDPLHRYLTVGVSTRTYDGRGNLTADGTLAYEYDPWNRLTKVSEVSGGAERVSYEHDALGRRTQEVVSYPSGAVERRFVYAGPQLLEEHTGSGGPFVLSARYIHGGGLDELVAFETGSGQRYGVLQDALGSVEVLTNWTSWTVQERYDYDAFGVTGVEDGSGTPIVGEFGAPRSGLGNRVGYAGACWDEAMGQYHMRARQYEPGVGQFVSRDPLRYVDGPNAYQYALGSPTDWRDPFGLDVKDNWKQLSDDWREQRNRRVREAYDRRGKPWGPEDFQSPYGALQGMVLGSAGGRWTLGLGVAMGYTFVEPWIESGAKIHDAGDLLFGDGQNLWSRQADLTGYAIAHGQSTGWITAVEVAEPALMLAGLRGAQLAKGYRSTQCGLREAEERGLRELADEAKRLAPGRSCNSGGTAAKGLDDILPTPRVSDPKLQNYVDNLYKGTTNPSRVGTGTTADAVRNELATGLPTGGTFHRTKAQETINGLRRWLRNNPNGSHSDRLVARSLMDDLVDALGCGQ
jgi:RHS repeat-associated protein